MSESTTTNPANLADQLVKQNGASHVDAELGKLRQVIEIGIVGGMLDADGAVSGTDAVRPCGRCRQILNEAAQLGGRDILVHCASGDGHSLETHRLSDLLPHAFGPADLGID